MRSIHRATERSGDHFSMKRSVPPRPCVPIKIASARSLLQPARSALMGGSARDRPDFRGESVAFLRRQYHVERRVEQALFLTVVFLQNLVKRGSGLVR